MADEDEIKTFVEELVQQNKPVDIIRKYLKKRFDISWSKSKLQRFQKEHEIQRYDRNLLPKDVMSAILTEADGSAQRLGYRMMWTRLRRHGLLATRDQVAACMQILGLQNQTPIQRRKHYPNYFSKGPNETWHIDGNDKLANWGFYTHGAIDGFSRKVLWLQVFVTNKDPWITAKYFMKAVINNQGCPTRVRCDPGTENGIIGRCQMFLRRHGDDPLAGKHSYYEGSSVVNQPIESFWRHFKEGGFQFWIDQFKYLQQSGKWNPGNTVHKLCLLYLYMPLLQMEADEMKEDWNTHRIRFQRGKDRPCGVPNDLYEFPSSKGAQEMKKNVLPSDTTYIEEKYKFNQQMVYLPQSFKAEADLFINSTGEAVDITNVSNFYDELVAHFSH